MVFVSLSSIRRICWLASPLTWPSSTARIDFAGKFTAAVGRIAGFGASCYLRGLRAGERL